MSNPVSTQVLYSERVTPKWTSFLPITLVLPTFWLTFAPINAPVGLTIGIVITAIIVWLMLGKAPVITVTSSQIKVGRAQIAISLTGSAASIPPESAFAERGPKLDSRAFICLQSSRKGLIRLEISDQNDPTPYWLFSAKNPSAVLLAIEKAKSQTGKSQTGKG